MVAIANHRIFLYSPRLRLSWDPKGSRCILVQGWQNVPQSSLRTRSYRGMELSKLLSNSNWFVKWSVGELLVVDVLCPSCLCTNIWNCVWNSAKLRCPHKTKLCFRDAINSSYCRFRWVPLNSSSWGHWQRELLPCRYTRTCPILKWKLISWPSSKLMICFHVVYMWLHQRFYEE